MKFRVIIEVEFYNPSTFAFPMSPLSFQEERDVLEKFEALVGKVEVFNLGPTGLITPDRVDVSIERSTK